MTPKQQALFCISQSIHVIAGYPVGKSERAIIKGTAEGTINEDLVNTWFDEIPNRNILINLKNKTDYGYEMKVVEYSKVDSIY